MKQELIERLLGKNIKDAAEFEAMYPPRTEGTIVTRIAPSPTGFMHIGGVFSALIDERIAHQSNGVFMIRIEDTDSKREVEGATDLILNSLEEYGIIADESPRAGGTYGPYVQSERADIYKAFMKNLLERDLAYPCFCTEEELENIRKAQMAQKLRPGYYGLWAKYRNMSEKEIYEALEKGIPFVLRFKSNGNWDNKRKFEDLSRGLILMPENDMDIVIMKSDGLPTYHFAHVVDDHLMYTSHVIRGDEWLASLPLHVQMFETLGWQPPHYTHTATIQKLDEGNRRKLSKRHDPEAAMSYYSEHGYPKEAVLDYLINLANSNYEDFKRDNPTKTYKDFELKLENLNNSGALLDLKKLENIAKEFIGTLSSSELYERYLVWAKTYDEKIAQKLEANKDYITSIFAIERDGIEKVRKDYYSMSMIWNELSYFFDETFTFSKNELLEVSSLSESDIKILIDEMKKTYSPNHTKDEWFANIKDIAARNGYAKNPKEAAKEPEKYKGAVSDVATVYRLLITGRTQSPDLYAIKQVLGADRVMKRLSLLD